MLRVSGTAACIGKEAVTSYHAGESPVKRYCGSFPYKQNIQIKKGE